MTETATPTTTSKPATARQRQLLADLSVELGRDIDVPATAKAASAVIAKTIRKHNAQLAETGTKPAPTLRQARLLEELGAERGKTYQLPATRAQASARIKQILAAGTPKPKTDAAPEAELVAA
ncbi:hypothetical protein C8N24_0281 [Solirubrobacter pauli]|uniref:Uncharacterized protein n=1 Tax=Solirubrobacter pauli TaxID=166793 RepID=A0A660L656_9ACTN|nr:hypothetical protein [Solirubrobacter pauli]RKQ90477.1 hypothetical protein C8N24_0281 [Solirubrobacter pauli]